jgi:membrane protein DedA with SNARE-associated domain
VNINHLLSQYGYAAVFVLVGAESLGIPLPGETILIAAGIYAGSTHKLSVWLIFVVLRRQSAKLAEEAEAAYPGPLPQH